jgi:hypothetical protein
MFRSHPDPMEVGDLLHPLCDSIVSCGIRRDVPLLVRSPEHSLRKNWGLSMACLRTWLRTGGLDAPQSFAKVSILTAVSFQCRPEQGVLAYFLSKG